MFIIKIKLTYVVCYQICSSQAKSSMCFIFLWINSQERHTCWIHMFKSVCSTWEGMTRNVEESRHCRASRSRGSCGRDGSHFLCWQWHRPWAGIPVHASFVCTCLRKSVGNLELCFFYMWKNKVQGSWIIFLCSLRWERTSLVRNGAWIAKKWSHHSKYFDKIFCFCRRVDSFTKSSKQTHPVENVLCVFNLNPQGSVPNRDVSDLCFLSCCSWLIRRGTAAREKTIWTYIFASEKCWLRRDI